MEINLGPAIAKNPPQKKKLDQTPRFISTNRAEPDQHSLYKIEIRNNQLQPKIDRFFGGRGEFSGKDEHTKASLSEMRV
jgi:hypothetical protein